MLKFQVLFTILLASGAYALFEDAPDVVNLTPSNFNELVINSNEIWIVKYYAPWCGWSVRAAPEYIRASCALKGIAKVGELDANRYPEFASSQLITGYPTFRLFLGRNQYSYSGPRTAESFIQAALEVASIEANNKLSTGACAPVNVFQSFVVNKLENVSSKVCAV